MNEAEPAVPDAGTNDRWRLDGRVALVTGASAGLGARFARVLHAAGAHVIATARRADRLEELAQHGENRMQTIAGDIADPHHRQAVIEIVRQHGRLDVLVNNAGTCDDTPGPRWASRPSPVLHSRHIPAPHREAMPGAAANQPQSHPEVRHAAYAPL